MLFGGRNLGLPMVHKMVILVLQNPTANQRAFRFPRQKTDTTKSMHISDRGWSLFSAKVGPLGSPKCGVARV